MATNDLGLDGIEFIEFSSPDSQQLDTLFTAFGFRRRARHNSKDMTHYLQGQINIIISNQSGSVSDRFKHEHGPCIPAMGWRTHDAKLALDLAVKRGAQPASEVDYTLDGSPVPAIIGIGGSLIYFIDRYNSDELYNKLGFTKKIEHPEFLGEMGFEAVDHLTNNVPKGTLLEWSEFYKNIFGFEEVRYFDIRGAKTGLTSYALRSPCGKFCIPINEGSEETSQINEYLREYKGSGIQHLAFTTSDIIKTVTSVKENGIKTLDIESDYYREVFERVPNVKEDKDKLEDLNILVDGDDDGYLLQIFTKNVVGPIFIEIIQRKNHHSFGEGNFGALFRSIEKDQEKRGVI